MEKYPSQITGEKKKEQLHIVVYIFAPYNGNENKFAFMSLTNFSEFKYTSQSLFYNVKHINYETTATFVDYL